MCYTLDKGILVDCRNLPNMSVDSHETAALIISLGFDALITYGIDMDMAEELCSAGVEVVAGAQGTAREVVEAYNNCTLMGATPLCHLHNCGGSAEEMDESDIDDAFDLIAEKLFATN